MAIAAADITPQVLRRLVEAARASAEVAAGDREARNEALYTADQSGWSTNRLHRETGLSLGHLQRILAQETARRQAVEVR